MSKNQQQEFLKIEGMSCANCALGIRKHLEKNGVQNVSVSFSSSEASFTKTEQHNFDNVKTLIQAIGYNVKETIQEGSSEKYTMIEKKNLIDQLTSQKDQFRK